MGDDLAGADGLLRELVEQRIVGVVQRPLRSYGFNECLELLPFLARHGATASPHSWGGFVVQYMAAHLARGWGHSTYLEADIMTIPEVDATGFVRRDGLLDVPDRPGFGWRLDPALFTFVAPVGVWE